MLATPGGDAPRQSDDRTSRTLALTSSGITLLGVLLSIGVSVGMGLEGPWWVRVLAGAATSAVLVAVVKHGSRTGRGPVARAAAWVIGERDPA